MIITKHNYVDTVKPEYRDEYMILGTIHPHNVDSFKIPFFYGNRGSLWSILQQAFPKCDFRSAETIKLELKSHRVFITDTIRKCERKNDSITSDSKVRVIEDNKKQIEDALHNSRIHTIFFTSGFGRNSAAGMFLRMFGIKRPQKSISREFIIAKGYFGRKIKGILLFSPSGAANIAIAQSSLYKTWRQKNSDARAPVNKFRIEFYREKFRNVFS